MHVISRSGRVTPDDVFAIEVEPDPRLVRAVRAFGASVARRFGCPEDLVQDVKVALSEACANATNAQTRAGVSEPLRLEVRCKDDLLSFSIADRGGGFDYSPDAHDGALSRAATDPMSILESGIGIGLIRALFPSATFERNDFGGTTVRFEVGLSREGS